MSEETLNFSLREPVSPEALVPDSRLEPWMIFVTIATILIITLAVFAIRRRQQTARSQPAAARDAAYALACAALEKTAPLGARDSAVQSSLALRTYLASAAADPALFETHEEFIGRHDSLKALTENVRQAAENGFNRLATLKYAATLPSIDAAEIRREAYELLTTLHHGFSA
jgi:hypothetical protein